MTSLVKKNDDSDHVNYKCECESNFLINEYLSQHIKAVHDKGDMNKISETNVVDQQDLKQEIDDFEDTGDHLDILNIELVENEGVVSPLKNSAIVSQQHLNPRNGQISKRKILKCNSCDFQAVRILHLSQHILSKHASDEERKKHLKKCPECDDTSFRTMCIKRHVEAT